MTVLVDAVGQGPNEHALLGAFRDRQQTRHVGQRADEAVADGVLRVWSEGIPGLTIGILKREPGALAGLLGLGVGAFTVDFAAVYRLGVDVGESGIDTGFSVHRLADVGESSGERSDAVFRSAEEVYGRLITIVIAPKDVERLRVERHEGVVSDGPHRVFTLSAPGFGDREGRTARLQPHGSIVGRCPGYDHG